MTTFDIFQNHFKIILPEFFFLSAILMVLTYGTLYNASAYYRYPIMTYAIGYLSIQTLIITIFLTANGPGSMAAWGAQGTMVIFNNALIMDTFASFVKTIVLIGTTATLAISFTYTLNQKMSARINEYIILILFSTLSMLLLVSSFDLISMYLAIELQSLSFYVLAAFQRNNEFSTEAGLKYFVLGALSSGLLLFGESLIYGFTGLTNFEELTKLSTMRVIESAIAVTAETGIKETINVEQGNVVRIYETTGLISSGIEPAWYQFLKIEYIESIAINIGLIFIIVAFLFKISAVPFHLWTPDVYEGAPTSVTAYFAITPKIAILALLLRICMYTFYDWIDTWQEIIIITSILSMFIGTLGAIHQNKIKRLFAYSSIAHVGYILIGLATGTIESIEALLIYIALYVFVTIGTFSILLVMARENFSIQTAQMQTQGGRQEEWKKNVTTGPWNGNSNRKIGKGGANPEAIYQPTELYLNFITETYDQNEQGKQELYPQEVGGAAVQPWTREQGNMYKEKNGTSKLPKSLSAITSKLQTKEKKAQQEENGSNEQKQEWTKWKYAATNLIQGNPIWEPYESLKKIKTSAIKASIHIQSGARLLKKRGSVGGAQGTGTGTGTSPKEKKVNCAKHITDFCSLAKANPILAFTAAMMFFSNAGIPPLAGFYGKLNVFLTAVENSMYFLALAGILCSVIGTFYSIRLVNLLYFRSRKGQTWHFYQSISKENAIVLALTFFFTLCFFLAPSFLFLSAHSAALSLCV